MTHIIKNFDQLATSNLRRQALMVAEAGLVAIDTKTAVRRAVKYDPETQTLKISGKRYNLGEAERVVCVGFGKVALDAVSELQSLLKDRITCGYVIDLKEGSLGNIICKVGSHPYPTKVNIQATKELLEMLGSCSEKDVVLCVVSGGGSALLCYPHDLTCEAEVAIIAALTVKGATIQELNTVRKHISQVKGGQLAKLMYPATVVSLIFSDVPSGDLSMVASGPTVLDHTTIRDAEEIMNKYEALKYCQLPSCKLTETPKEQKYFEKINNILVVSSQQALSAMRQQAEELGFEVKIFSESFQGIARELGPEILQDSHKGQCLLGAGESTVKVLGHGLGGRNQEMALAALPNIGENQVLACVASDGHDNTDAAGAVADAGTAARAKSLGLDISQYLDNNDSYHFFEQTGDLIQTGLTGENVSDFFVCLKN